MAMYDVVVVGAGIEGSATAYYLLKKGLHVLLLEQVDYLANPAIATLRCCRFHHPCLLPVLGTAQPRQLPRSVSDHPQSLRQASVCPDDERCLHSLERLRERERSHFIQVTKRIEASLCL